MWPGIWRCVKERRPSVILHDAFRPTDPCWSTSLTGTLAMESPWKVDWYSGFIPANNTNLNRLILCISQSWTAPWWKSQGIRTGIIIRSLSELPSNSEILLSFWRKKINFNSANWSVTLGICPKLDDWTRLYDDLVPGPVYLRVLAIFHVIGIILCLLSYL